MKQEFIDRVVSAVQEGDAAIRRLGETKRLPRFSSWVKLSYNDAGWPSFVRTLTTGPVDYRGCFSFQPGSINGPLFVDDIPSFGALVEYVRSDSELANRLAPGNLSNDLDFLKYIAIGFATQIIGRLRHTDKTASDENIKPLLAELYRPYEDSPLPVQVLVPLVLTSFGDVDEIKLTDELHIERMGEDTQISRVPDMHLPSDVNEWVADAATHALVIGDYQVRPCHPWIRKYERDELPIERIETAITAIRLATGLDTGYAQICLRPLGWADSWRGALPTIIQAMKLRRYPPQFEEHGWRQKSHTIDASAIERLPKIVKSLITSPSNVRLAARRLSTSTLREDPEDRILDACVGLEAIAGDGQGELNYKLAMRVAALLSIEHEGNSATPAEIASIVKKVYSYRSAVAHGNASQAKKCAEIQLGDYAIPTHLMAEVLLREALNRVIENPDLAKTGRLDQIIIDRIAEAP